jgi:hypothetical protein
MIGSHEGLKAVRAIFMVAALSVLGACASGGRPAEMTASAGSIIAVSPGMPGYKALRVARVQGGGKTNPLWISNVADSDFQSALETSLRASNYLADDPANAKTEITASLIDLKRPMAGIDLTVTTRVRYSGAAVSGGQTVFDETIAATGTAKFGDAIMAFERLRLANEAAVKANIEAFMARLKEVLK